MSEAQISPVKPVHQPKGTSARNSNRDSNMSCCDSHCTHVYAACLCPFLLLSHCSVSGQLTAGKVRLALGAGPLLSLHIHRENTDSLHLLCICSQNTCWRLCRHSWCIGACVLNTVRLCWHLWTCLCCHVIVPVYLETSLNPLPDKPSQGCSP